MFDDMLQLSTPQADIWYAQQLMPDIPFAIAYYVDVSGTIDVDLLITSGLRAHAEYSSVTMRIVEIDGRPVQAFTDRYDAAAQIVDLRGEADALERAHSWMETECRSPLPLDGCLVRLRLFRLSDDHILWYTRAHHIALDGYASVRVLERAAAIYNAVVMGEEPESVDVTAPSAIVEEDRRYQTSARARRDQDFWHAAATEGDDSAAPSLGRVAAPQSMSATVSGDAESNPLSSSGLNFSGGQSTSSLVIAAFAVFLARMTDSDDARLSLPVSARSTAVLRRAGSSTSNVVPLALAGIGRTTIDGAVKFTETSIGAVLRHQRSRPDVLRERGGQSTPIRSFGPTVNVMMFAHTVAVGGVEGQVHILTTGPVSDLAVDIYPDGAGRQPRIDFEANPAAYSRRDLSRYHRRFLQFLHAFANRSIGDMAVSDLDLFLPDESRTSASTGAASTEHMTMVDAFDSAVRCHPDLSAVEDGEAAWTYRELNEKVDRLAGILRERGIGPEDSVAVRIARSIESVVAFWAVARAGSVYVPIDPRLPDERVEYIIRDCRAVIGLGLSPDGTDRWGEIDWLGGGDASDSQPPPTTRWRTASPLNAAYVIYTSGSTGVPKGVVVTHAGIGGLVQQIRHSYGLDASSRVCHLASPGFDTAVVEHLASAVAGACLVIAPPDAYAGPELTRLLARRRLTHLLITPSSLATLEESELTDVATVIIGGESAPTDVIDTWSPGRRLLNAYGPTEATCSVTMTESLRCGDAVGIGTAMVGATIHLLDRSLRAVPPGAIGEIYIATAGLARGYSHLAPATASRFVANPFGENGSRLFRSGDMARSGVDGSLTFIGRTDDQVKIRGNRVELGEVDAALRAHPNVVAAASMIRRNHRGDARIDGYVVCRTGVSMESQEVRGFLAQTLPGYAVPSTITVLDAIPLTVNRKLDRSSLPEPAFVAGDGTIAIPSGPAETAVAAAYSQVLGVDAVDVTTSFFDLGGDSLAATGVITRLRTDLGVDLGIRDLVDASSVRALAEVIVARPRGHTRSDRPRIGMSDEVSVIPLAPQQIHIDRSARLPLYNLSFTVEITGPLEVEVVEAAFGDLLYRHRSLRTIFPDSPVGPRQLIVDDPSTVNSAFRTALYGEDAVKDVLSAPFDVRTQLPIRAVLFEKAGDGHLLACSVHHIAADGWSLGMLARDFAVAFSSRMVRIAPGWTDVALHYTDFSVWAESKSHTRDLEFWRKELSDLPFDTTVQTDRPRLSDWDYTGDSVELDMNAATVEGLDRIAQQYRTSRFTILRSALIVLLMRLTGERDIVIGTPIGGREDPILEQVVGMFVNTLAIRSDIGQAATFEEVVGIAHASEVRALDHSGVSFDHVAAELDPGPHQGRHPLFQVALSLDRFTALQFEVEGTHFEVTPRPLGIAKCDLHFHVVERRNSSGAVIGLNVGIVYPTALFDRATVQGWGEFYVRILRRMMSDPEAEWATVP